MSTDCNDCRAFAEMKDGIWVLRTVRVGDRVEPDNHTVNSFEFTFDYSLTDAAPIARGTSAPSGINLQNVDVKLREALKPSRAEINHVARRRF
jgi:hypothetical protein